MEYEMTGWIQAHFRSLLRPGMTGEVILVSSSGVYLKLEEQILLLCDQSWGTLPIGIGVADFDWTISLLHPRQGQRITVTEDSLWFQSGKLRLMVQSAVSERPRDGTPQIGRILQAAAELASLRKKRGISMLVLPLVLGRTPEQSEKLNPHSAYGYHYLSSLMIALEHGDSDEIRSCVEKLLGLGPGLTPSADDCLLGMLYVFRALPQKAPEGAKLLSEYIEKICDYCTNQISAAFLKAVIAGAPFERMESVFQGLCGEETLNIEKLTQIGSSSGSEMLLGMLIALKLCGYDVAQREELP